jgi:RNA polymerase sigma-70 factor (ECF subfamily)
MTFHGGALQGEGEGRARKGSADDDIIQRARAGDRDAQGALVRAYSPGLYNLFSRVLKDRHAALDLTQETFIKVFGGLHRFELGRSFRSWLFAIAWNIARDHLRRARRRRGIASLDAHAAANRPRSWGRLHGEDSMGFDAEDRRSPAILETLEERERAAVVREALSRLEPGRRALLVLKEFEDLSYEELADLFRCGVATARSRVHRARAALKDEIAALRPEWFREPCGGSNPASRTGPYLEGGRS